jgi:FdhD protein
MKITDLCTDAVCVETEDLIRIDSLTAIPRQEERTVLHEHLMDVYINEKLSLKMVCTPRDLAALVLGHLFSEGRIDGVEDIRSIYVCAQGAHARVLTTRPLPEAIKPIEIRACDCAEDGVMGRALLSCETEVDPADVLPDFDWEPRWIHTLAMAFKEDAPLHRLTHGIHSCFLMKDGEILYLCEDIGRHNALDKALGRALMDGVDLHQCILFSSGRIPDDMMEKVIRARVPVLASNAVPTDKAVALARRYHVTLICTARPDGMNVFSSKEFW